MNHDTCVEKIQNLSINFKKKVKLFNDFFNNQCHVVINNIKLSEVLTKKTCKSLITVELLTSVILNMVRNQNPNKAHDHNMAYPQVLKVCDESIYELLETTS